MSARLGFAIATAWNPEILILDEVLTVGDAAFQLKCYARLRELLVSGATVLMVSHSGKVLLEECSRCLWLAEGRLVADGKPREVLERYEPPVPAQLQEAVTPG